MHMMKRTLAIGLTTWKAALSSPSWQPAVVLGELHIRAGNYFYERSMSALGQAFLQWRREFGKLWHSEKARRLELCSQVWPAIAPHRPEAPQGLELFDRVRDDPANGQPVAFRAWPQPSPRRPSANKPVVKLKPKRSSRTAIADMLSRPAYVAPARYRLPR